MLANSAIKNRQEKQKKKDRRSMQFESRQPKQSKQKSHKSHFGLSLHIRRPAEPYYKEIVNELVLISRQVTFVFCLLRTAISWTKEGLGSTCGKERRPLRKRDLSH